jgi:hypothetical protein
MFHLWSDFNPKVIHMILTDQDLFIVVSYVIFIVELNVKSATEDLHCVHLTMRGIWTYNISSDRLWLHR